MSFRIRGDVTISRSLRIQSLTEAQKATVFSVAPPAGTLVEISDGSNAGLQRFSGVSWVPVSAPSVQVLTDAATITWDTAVGQYGYVTIAGNRTIAAPTNHGRGAIYSLEVTADATPRTLTFDSAFHTADDVALPAVTIPALESRTWVFLSNGTNLLDVSHGASAALSNQNLTYGATVAWDVALGAQGSLSITGVGPTMGAPTNLTAGQFYVLLASNATGSTQTLTFPAAYTDADGATLAADAIAAGDTHTYIFYSPDGTGLVRTGGAASAVVAALVGATGAAAGTAGLAPQPSAGEQDLVLHGDAAWRELFPAWAATTDYSTGAVIFEGGVIYKRAAAGTSGATFDATEKANWTVLASANLMTGAAFATAGTAGAVPAPAAQENGLFLRGDATWSEVLPDFATSTEYSAGSLVYVAVDPDGVPAIYRRNAAGTSSAVDFATDAAFWTKVASESDSQEQFVVTDITARDAIATATTGDIAYVVDASADALVNAGAAMYVYDGSAWQRIAEFESLDLTDMTGATVSAAGAAGLVPAPVAGNEDKVLQGDGTWVEHDVIQVLDQIDFVTAEPAAPTDGDRYIATATGNSSVTTQSVVIAHLYKWDGTTWLDVTPAEGQMAYNAATDVVLFFDGTTWQSLDQAPDASVKGAWAAATAYIAGDIVVTPAGALVQRIADGTSTGQYDATEAAAWNLIQNGAPLDGWPTSATYIYADQMLIEGSRLWSRTADGMTVAGTFDAVERALWTEVTSLDLTVAAEVSADTTAVVGELLPVDSTSGTINIAPPANPEVGDRFAVVDSRAQSAVNNITVTFNTNAADPGQTWFGFALDFNMNSAGAYLTCTFAGGAIGWILSR